MSHPEFSERGGQRTVDCVNRSLLIKKPSKQEKETFSTASKASPSPALTV